MKSLTITLLTVLAISVIAVADDGKDNKSQVFDDPFESVWAACIASANENFVIEHSKKESGILNFHSGTSLTSNGFRVGVVVMKTDGGKVRVQLNTQKKKQLFAWGAGGRISEKFFKGVDRFLKEGKAKS